MLMDSMNDEADEEIEDVATSWDLEVRAPLLLEYLEDDGGKMLLDCGMMRLEEVDVTIRLCDNCAVVDIVVAVELADAEVEIERLVEKTEADLVVHVALSLRG